MPVLLEAGDIVGQRLNFVIAQVLCVRRHRRSLRTHLLAVLVVMQLGHNLIGGLTGQFREQAPVARRGNLPAIVGGCE